DASQNSLKGEVQHNRQAQADKLNLGQVKVWGAGEIEVKSVTVQSGQQPANPVTTFSHDLTTQQLIMDLSALLVPVDQPFTITWKTTA
ncbi:hypothetical protein AGOR_G00128460, partial [Albula goreensis]